MRRALAPLGFAVACSWQLYMGFFSYEWGLGIGLLVVATIAVSANVTNDGSVEGKETVEAYAVPPGPDEPARLIGWSKIDLAPGETHRVSITADPRLVAQFEVDRDRWHIAKGDYGVRVGTSSQSLGDMMHVTLDEQVLPP